MMNPSCNEPADFKATLSIPTPMSAKAEEIRRVLSEPVVDLWKLRELALTEGGLVNGKSPQMY
jgi:hypothetical protein